MAQKWRARYKNQALVTVVELPDYFGDLSDYPAGYNKVLWSKYIWKEVVQCENVLVTQTDALLLSHGLEEFFRYDYVGAPVYVKSFPSLNWRYYCTLTNRCGGCGGLSLRTRKVMLRALDECKVPKDAHDEDVWFSACLIQMGPIGA